MGGLLKNKEEDDLLDAYISTSVDARSMTVSVRRYEHSCL